jgi:HK97 family phage prohead protease
MPWHIRSDHPDCSGFAVVKNDDGSLVACHKTRDEAEAQMRALYASEGRAAEDGNVESRPQRAPVEVREATLGNVNFPQRLIEVVAVPYGGEAVVEYRGEVWLESFERGAFDGIEQRPNRVKAIRDHDKTRLVGRATNFWPDREEGLVSEIRIAKTPLGDETLTLADEGMLDVSAGFAARNSDQVFDRSKQSRKIRKAFLDHLAFVADGAYEDAKVVAVRSEETPSAAQMPRLDTPNLDEVVAWMKKRGVL